MVQVIKQSTPFGQASENFGKSFGDTIGDEIGRKVAISKLPEISDRLVKSGKIDQLSIFSELMKTPGMTDQRAASWMPMIMMGVQQAAARNLEQAQGGGDPFIASQPVQGQPQQVQQVQPQQVQQMQPQQTFRQGAQSFQPQQVQPQPQTQQVQQVQGEPTPTLVTPDMQGTILQAPTVMTPLQVKVEASRLMRSNPGIYQNLEQAENAVVQENAAKNANLAAQQQVAGTAQAQTDTIRKKTQDLIIDKLQAGKDKSDSWGQLPATIQNRLIDQAVDSVSKGSTQDAAARDVSNTALSFAKQIKSLQSKGDIPFFGNDEKAIQELANYQPFFAKHGALEEYKGYLTGKGMGENTASLIAYPPSVSLKKEIAKLEKQKPPQSNLSYILSEPQLWKYYQELNIKPVNEDTQKVANQVASSISKNDSINAAALLFNNYGYNEEQLYTALDNLQSQGLFEPTETQQLEINERLPVQQSLIDILQTAMPGKSSGPYGFLRGLTRYIGGKK